MKEGKWLVTSTMAGTGIWWTPWKSYVKSDFFLYKFDVYNSGYLCVWMPLVCMALEDPPDPKKNIRELKRYFKLSDEGLTYFTVYKE